MTKDIQIRVILLNIWSMSHHCNSKCFKQNREGTNRDQCDCRFLLKIAETPIAMVSKLHANWIFVNPTDDDIGFHNHQSDRKNEDYPWRSPMIQLRKIPKQGQTTICFTVSLKLTSGKSSEILSQSRWISLNFYTGIRFWCPIQQTLNFNQYLDLELWPFCKSQIVTEDSCFIPMSSQGFRSLRWILLMKQNKSHSSGNEDDLAGSHSPKNPALVSVSGDQLAPNGVHLSKSPLQFPWLVIGKIPWSPETHHLHYSRHGTLVATDCVLTSPGLKACEFSGVPPKYNTTIPDWLITEKPGVKWYP